MNTTVAGVLPGPDLHLPAHSVNQAVFEYFTRYDYESWKPPQIRRDWVTAWVGPGDFLDIGCGGYPVSMDVPDGLTRGVGADIAVRAVQRFRNYFKEFFFLDIEQATSDEVPELHSRFNTVIMSETLEHFRDPTKVLKTVSTFIAPGGRLLITYPNAFSIAQLMDRLLHGGVWHRFSDFHDGHVYLVPKRELERLFASAGFRIRYFDFRPSDVIAGFPKERTAGWKGFAKLFPSFLGHQFFYVLERIEN
jgi:2-polyprenyl-3-methyl-5-hydroxy-6-metoxy-1,4-benzoquinol methylase